MSELQKIIDEARKNGSITFETDDYERDRSKLYRLLQAEQKGPQLPLFPLKPLGIKTNKERSRITVAIKEEKIKIVAVKSNTDEKPTAVIPVKKRKKEPRWIERWREDIVKAEENPQFHKDNPACRDAWEYFDSLKFVMDLYMEEEDDELESAIRDTYENFTKHLFTYFGKYVDKELKAIEQATLTDKIILNVKRRGELSPESTNAEERRELKYLLDEHERLLKLKDEEDSRKDLF